MGLPGIQSVGGNLKDSEIQKKISSFVSKYIDKFQDELRKRNLATGFFSFGRPTNYYFSIDKQNLHIIYSSQFAGEMAEVIYMDFREQQKDSFAIDEIANFLRAQKGITGWQGLTFEISILDKPELEKEEIMTERINEQIKIEYQKLIQTSQPLFISKEQLITFLQKASEDDFTNILLIPLLRHIGFKTAEAKGHRDKTLEFGQDVQRMKIQLPTGHWLYFSAQVKKGDVKAGTETQEQNVEKVLTQTQMQLEWEMPDPETNQNVKPDHILLIVSGDITEAAKQYIFKHTLYQRKRVLLWEKETIIRLCEEQGLPETVQKIILDYNKNKLSAI